MKVELATTSGEKWRPFRDLGQKSNESSESEPDISGSFKSAGDTGPREADAINELRGRLLDRE